MGIISHEPKNAQYVYKITTYPYTGLPYLFQR